MLDKVKELREKTSAGMMDCKKALQEASGDLGKAIDILRKKGVSLASKRSSRAAKEGLIVSYIHTNHKIGVLLEVNCETDFVARNADFKSFVKELSMQIAAINPSYISKDDVPEETKLDRQRQIMQLQELVAAEQSADKIGQTLRVLVDEVDAEQNVAIARSKWDAPEIDGNIFLPPTVLKGKFYNARIVDADIYDLTGEID